MKTYKAVILGCGPRAEYHASAYKYNNNVDLVACCDMNQERREDFAGRYRLRAYSELTKMVQAEKPDIIHLVTPPGLRLQLMQEVSELGIPGCVVEKPIALGVMDYLAIRELSTVTNTKFIVNHQFRYHPQFLKCRSALESGKLGKNLFMDVSARMNISNQGTHILDYMMSLNSDSPVVRVFGNVSGVDRIDRHHPAPESTMGMLTFENGVRATWNTGIAAPYVLDDEAIYKHCREAVYAERGRILFEEFNRWEIISSDGLESGHNSPEVWSDLNDRSQAALVDSLAAWLDNDAVVSESNLDMALHQWNVVLALYASAMTHKPIDLPYQPEQDLLERLMDKLEK